jgi:hypothetical protein
VSTRYPTALPDIWPALPDRWGCLHGKTGGDMDEGTAFSEHTITADTAEDAEKRVLAVIAYDYSDMRKHGYLEDAVATAHSPDSQATDVWVVRINYRRTS